MNNLTLNEQKVKEITRSFLVSLLWVNIDKFEEEHPNAGIDLSSYSPESVKSVVSLVNEFVKRDSNTNYIEDIKGGYDQVGHSMALTCSGTGSCFSDLAMEGANACNMADLDNRCESLVKFCMLDCMYYGGEVHINFVKGGL